MSNHTSTTKIGNMWVVLFLLFFNALALQGRDTTCSVQAVEEGYQTQLTCHFPSDISDSQYSLTVLFYRDTNPNNPITVAYSALSNGKHEFFIHPEYSFDENVSDQVNILIPKASKDYEGTYVCQSDRSFTAKSCTFKLRVPKIPAAGSLAESIKSTIAAPMLNEKEFRQSDSLNTLHIAMVVLVAILTVLVIFVIIAAVVWVIHRKRSKSCISKTSRTNNSSDSVKYIMPDEHSKGMSSTDTHNPLIA